MTENEPRVPRRRREALPPGGLVVVVRGSDSDAAGDRRQAEQFRRRYADWEKYGLSAYFARSEAGVDDLAADRLERFPMLRVYRRDALVAAGIDVVPTFRTPHVTLAFEHLDAGLRALGTVEHEHRRNPYHEPEEGP